MTTFEIVRDLVLLVLGGTGAALSIYNFVDIRRRSSRRLKVSFMTNMPFYEGKVGDPILKVTVTNLGQRNVTVTNLGIELPEKRTLATLHSGCPGFADSPMPATLADGEIAYRYFAYADLSKTIRNSDLPSKVDLKSFAVDSAGDRHYGEKISFDAQRW